MIRQVVGPGGWLADAEDLWATGHEAWWRMPTQASLLRIYETAYHGSGRPAVRCKDGKPCCQAGKDPAKAARATRPRRPPPGSTCG